jgi:[CysO sulfur-carrier protein]-S-L-cysteine hydrolase
VDPLDENGIWLPARLWKQMRGDVEAHLPQEACGLVGGLQRRALQVYPATNVLHSPVSYRMEAGEQVRIILGLEKLGWDLLAIYHSHPAGPDHPSPTDLAEAAYPEAVYLIWFPQASEWDCRGYLIRDGQYNEIPVQVVEE